jgi:hypothetical protein
MRMQNTEAQPIHFFKIMNINIQFGKGMILISE